MQRWAGERQNNKDEAGLNDRKRQADDNKKKSGRAGVETLRLGYTM